jgi:uracil-DNA glycosylase
MTIYRLPESWEDFLGDCLDLDLFYKNLIDFLSRFESILPEYSLLFNVFNFVSPEKVRCVVYGEDPYPRKTSACGIAFWDKEINQWNQKTRGSSLKNILKALLVAKGWADYDTTIERCRTIASCKAVKSPPELFEHWLNQGVFLINTALTYSGQAQKNAHFQFWKPFHETLIRRLNERSSSPYYVLWGKHAASRESLILKNIDNPNKIIKQNHPTFIHHFLDKDQKQYSPFVELYEKTGINWM